MIRLTDEQWERIRKHFPEEHIPDGRAGRKPIPTRHVLEAVLWILNTGAQWHMLPQSYPNYKTVHRRFQTWCCNEILRLVLTDVANELRENGALDEEECYSGMTSFFLPVTFTNTDPVSGIVHKCSVVVTRADNKEQNYYLEWFQFHAFDKTKERWDFQDMAAPFPIAAKSADRRYILFR